MMIIIMAMAADRIVANKTSNVFESLKHYVNVIILNKNKSYITREITTTIIIKIQAERTACKQQKSLYVYGVVYANTNTIQFVFVFLCISLYISDN